MEVLVYEFLTGGGWHAATDSIPPPSLLREGRAMVRAMVHDLAKIGDPRTSVIWDRALPVPADWGGPVNVVAADAANGDQTLIRAAARADWTVLIAPEFDRHLLRLATQVLAAGGRLLGPSPDVIQICSDKHQTAEWLQARGVNASQGERLTAVQGGSAWPKPPLVLKPFDGAGSQGVRLLHGPLVADDQAWQEPGRWRVERFYPGTAASVSLLCGPEQQIALPAFQQTLADDGSFAYLGGSYPLPTRLAERACQLAMATIKTLPSPFGYLGVDLVLGAAANGSEDVVIEVNPRLTTSYVGLRAICQQNLARAMLAVASGETPSLSFTEHPIRFDPAGKVTAPLPRREGFC